MKDKANPMATLPEFSSIKQILVFTADPWESALPVLRYREPARLIGISVTLGNQGAQINLKLIEQADLVLIQRDFPRFTPAWVEVLLAARKHGKPVVYETDDLLFDLPVEHPSHHDLSLYTMPMFWAIQEADLATTSTSFIADSLHSIQPNTHILPNFLNDHLWTLRPPQPASHDQPATIGFMGGKTHLQDLEMIAPALNNVLQRYPGRVNLRFWGGKPPTELLENSNVDWTPLNILDYFQFSTYFNHQHIDIAIAPLEDNLLNRGKSPIKFLEYSALGAAGVFSHMPGYAAIVQNGENGFLCRDLDAWEACLAELIENPQKRLEMAKAAQTTVRESWLLSEHASLWGAAYQSVHHNLKPAYKPIQRPLELLTKSQEFLLTLEKEWSHSTHQLKSQQAEIAHLSEKITHQAQQLQRTETRAAQLQTEINNQNSELEVLRIRQAQLAQIADLLETHEDLAEMRIREILTSRTWRFALRLQKIRNTLIPNNSPLEKFFQKLGVVSKK